MSENSENSEDLLYSNGFVFASYSGQCDNLYFPPNDIELCRDWVKGFAAWIADYDVSPRQHFSVSSAFSGMGLSGDSLRVCIDAALWLVSPDYSGDWFRWPSIPVLPSDPAAGVGVLFDDDNL